MGGTGMAPGGRWGPPTSVLVPKGQGLFQHLPVPCWCWLEHQEHQAQGTLSGVPRQPIAELGV